MTTRVAAFIVILLGWTADTGVKYMRKRLDPEELAMCRHEGYSAFVAPPLEGQEVAMPEVFIWQSPEKSLSRCSRHGDLP
jgi:hypothetical protein